MAKGASSKSAPAKTPSGAKGSSSSKTDELRSMAEGHWDGFMGDSSAWGGSDPFDGQDPFGEADPFGNHMYGSKKAIKLKRKKKTA